MTSDVYHQLKVNGSTSCTFIITNVADEANRTLNELPLPYIRDALIYDEITMDNTIHITAEIKCGSGYPYTTTTLARAAVIGLYLDMEITSVTLVSGTWDGADFSTDAALSCWNLPDSSRSMFLSGRNISESSTDRNVLKVVFSLKQGAQL